MTAAAAPAAQPAARRMRLPRLASRLSFRALLLVAFLAIGLLLGGTAIRAVLILQQLMAQSQAEAARALEFTAGAQALTAHSSAMERAARQSLVFNDPVLQRRFEEERRRADAALVRLARAQLPDEATRRWRAVVAEVREALPGPPETALDRERIVAAHFRELDSVNSGIARAVQDHIEGRERALRDRLAGSSLRLMQQVAIAIGVTTVLALLLGLWLARPFKRLERAVQRLGENQLDQPIDIRGAADVRRLSEQLDWLRLRLAELDADKARFLRHISHELKTPLAALREGVSLLEDGVAGALTADQREVAAILRQNTMQLQQQIEALLHFNAAAFEARQLRRERCDLVELVRQQVDAQRLQWQAAGLHVVVRGRPLVASVDADKLGTAIANLLSNAIRHSPAGGTIELSVFQDTSQGSGRACIDIRDEGPGVSPPDRDRIFEPFYRGERQPPHAVRGTGIGLSIVHEYIAAHGGRIMLMERGDTPGASGPTGARGAHFRIELPHGN